jgi:hypothetical protein
MEIQLGTIRMQALAELLERGVVPLKGPYLHRTTQDKTGAMHRAVFQPWIPYHCSPFNINWE